MRQIGTVGKLPGEEIIYQRVLSVIDYASPGELRLGFVDPEGNTDGSNLNHLTPAPVYPMYTSDDAMLVFGNIRSYESIYVITGTNFLLYDFQSHGFAVPDRIAPISDTHEAIIVTMDEGGAPEDIPYSLRRINLENGKVLATYLTTHPDGKSVTWLEIGTNALDNQDLVFVRWSGNPRHYALVLLNIESRQEIILLDSATLLSAPAFSPDGQWIAYGNVDGVYLLNRTAEGGAPRKVVAAVSAERAPLAPSWSPDGQWLVYHDCLRKCDEDIDDAIEPFTIYKVNVETEERVMLVNGGINPFWRKTGQTNVESSSARKVYSAVMAANRRLMVAGRYPCSACWVTKPSISRKVILSGGSFPTTLTNCARSYP